MIDILLTERLLEFYDSWNVLGIEKMDLQDLRRFPIKEFPLPPPMPYFGPIITKEEHYGRVRYFAELLLYGGIIDPIEVDNFTNNNHIYPEPILLDGHHRLCGSDVARIKTIPSNYSGRVDLLNYLKGTTLYKPER